MVAILFLKSYSSNMASQAGILLDLTDGGDGGSESD